MIIPLAFVPVAVVVMLIGVTIYGLLVEAQNARYNARYEEPDLYKFLMLDENTTDIEALKLRINSFYSGYGLYSFVEGGHLVIKDVLTNSTFYAQDAESVVIYMKRLGSTMRDITRKRDCIIEETTIYTLNCLESLNSFIKKAESNKDISYYNIYKNDIAQLTNKPLWVTDFQGPGMHDEDLINLYAQIYPRDKITINNGLVEVL